MQEARCGTLSRVSRITPWAAGSAKPLSHPGCPRAVTFFFLFFFFFLRKIFYFIYFFLRFIYLFMKDTHTHTHTHTERERERERQREKQAPCKEPDVGLDPGSPGSCLGLKAGAKPLSHPGIPCLHLFK